MHQFARPPADLRAFRDALDADLSARNADYQAHRAEGVGIPAPELIETKEGTFGEWMRSMGKFGGQHKVPRMDASGTLTEKLVTFVNSGGMRKNAVGPG